MQRTLICLLATLAVATTPSASRAAEDPTKDGWPTELSLRPLTLAPGMFELTFPGNVNLSSGNVGKPVFLNPSLYYGVTDALTVGVRHFTGICPVGTGNGCRRFYDDASLDALLSLFRSGSFEAALGAALNASSFDPLTLSADGRLALRWRSEIVAVTAAPQLTVGITERETGVTYVAGGLAGTGALNRFHNREVLHVPVDLQVQATPRLAVLLGAALTGPLDPPSGGFGDFYRIPVSAGLEYAVSSMLDVGAAFTFTNLAGKDSTADDRLGKAYARVRW